MSPDTSNFTPDIFGRALMDHYQGKQNDPLYLFTQDSPDLEVMPVDLFFRQGKDFPDMEQIALALCDGSVLDVGAGAGSHTLFLQERGYDVTALERSPLACQVMQQRGVKQLIQADIFHYNAQQYDTLLFLMNGIGLVQSISGLEGFLEHAKRLLKPGGQLLFDSSDIAYFYTEGLPSSGPYYGEIRFQYEYQDKKSEPFQWLYIDQATLIRIGHAAGWVVQILDEDDHFQYLVRMELASKGSVL